MSTTAERTLIAAGSGDHVSETRRKFQEAVKGDFVGVVEQITGREVRVFLSQVDIEANLAVEFFIFAAPGGSG
ncbi:MAG: Na-translocating system protein MpsC family protein [Solirubrobacterales bacterium]